MVKARNVVRIGGGVTVRDYRGTGLCPPNGGAIFVDAWVEHIPVIENRPGIEDGLTLGRALRDQGYAVPHATDADGNLFLYTSIGRLCYHARGLNHRAGGTEHMHYATDDPWNELQCRAAALSYVRVGRRCDLPYTGGKLAPAGAGLAAVVKRGHVSHKRVSAAAGYHDRSDPGALYPWRHIVRLAEFFEERGTFRGAPRRA